MPQRPYDRDADAAIEESVYSGDPVPVEPTHANLNVLFKRSQCVAPDKCDCGIQDGWLHFADVHGAWVVCVAKPRA